MKKVIYLLCILLTFSCSDDEGSGENGNNNGLPSIPVLLSPANSSDVIISDPLNNSVMFTWQPSTGNLHPTAPYTIEVDDDFNFASPQFFSTDETFGSFYLPPPATTYYWRVRSNDVNFQSQGFSDSWSVNLIDANESPSVPQLQSPSDLSTISIISTNNPITFSWLASTDPNNDLSEYEIEVTQDINFNSIDYTNTTSTTSVDVVGLTLSEDYFWRVKARDSNGNESQWSDVWELFVLDASAPSQPQLIFPVNGENCQASNLTIDWDDSTDPNGLSITYELAISDTPNITSAAQIYTTTVSEYTLNLTPGQAYYWQVTADNGSSSSASSIFSFYAQGQGSGNTAPFLTQRSPSSGTTTNNTFIDLTIGADDAETSQSNLQIEVFFGDSPQNLTSIFNTTGGSPFSIQESLPNNTVYYWKVHVTDSDGATYVSQVWNIERQ